MNSHEFMDSITSNKFHQMNKGNMNLNMQKITEWTDNQIYKAATGIRVEPTFLPRQLNNANLDYIANKLRSNKDQLGKIEQVIQTQLSSSNISDKLNDEFKRFANDLKCLKQNTHPKLKIAKHIVKKEDALQLEANHHDKFFDFSQESQKDQQSKHTLEILKTYTNHLLSKVKIQSNKNQHLKNHFESYFKRFGLEEQQIDYHKFLKNYDILNFSDAKHLNPQVDEAIKFNSNNSSSLKKGSLDDYSLFSNSELESKKERYNRNTAQRKTNQYDNPNFNLNVSPVKNRESNINRNESKPKNGSKNKDIKQLSEIALWTHSIGSDLLPTPHHEDIKNDSDSLINNLLRIEDFKTIVNNKMLSDDKCLEYLTKYKEFDLAADAYFKAKHGVDKLKLVYVFPDKKENIYEFEFIGSPDELVLIVWKNRPEAEDPKLFSPKGDLIEINPDKIRYIGCYNLPNMSKIRITLK